MMRLVSVVLLVAACASEPQLTWDLEQDTTARVAMVTGLAGPEAVRYDPDQDVWFVANFNGQAAGDSNGFIARVTAEGLVDSLRFMRGTLAPLHGPRGMYITGDTLWAADAEGVHGFNRRTGAHVVFVDFRMHAPGFLNDIIEGLDGALYITDTGGNRVFRLAGRDITVALADTALPAPNGIALDAADGRMLLASWGPGNSVHGWDGAATTPVGTNANGRFDGIERYGAHILLASQADSSLHALRDGRQWRIVSVPGRPADIGVDTRRGRVAVPYIALDRVDIWALPPRD